MTAPQSRSQKWKNSYCSQGDLRTVTENKGSYYIMIHKDKVTDTSTHHEQMENFMAAEVFVKCVKYRKFQSIDYTTDGVDDAAR